MVNIIVDNKTNRIIYKAVTHLTTDSTATPDDLARIVASDVNTSDVTLIERLFKDLDVEDVSIIHYDHNVDNVRSWLAKYHNYAHLSKYDLLTYDKFKKLKLATNVKMQCTCGAKEFVQLMEDEKDTNVAFFF